MPLKLMTWNVWDVPGVKSGPKRLDAVADALAALARDPDGPDVVLLQELWPSRRRAAFKSLGWPHVGDADSFAGHWLNWIGKPLETVGAGHMTLDSGLLVLSKHPVKEVRRKMYSSRGSWKEVFREGEAAARKSAVAALVEVPSFGPVWVVDTHLCSSYAWNDNRAVRLSQIRELGAFACGLPRAPVVLAGDLNVGPPRAGAGHGHDAEIWGALLAALPGFSCAPDTGLFATCSPSKNKWVNAEDGENSLDHVFAGPGLSIERAAPAMMDPVDVGLADGTPMPRSDHFAVVADIVRNPS
ncbi:Endonuclease/exonuclease/phosphatase [Hyaloraphidium curvatum]|nr:Endonuclease/exonuclease/phosphatase [Hyaloraphidium curvatum]